MKKLRMTGTGPLGNGINVPGVGRMRAGSTHEVPDRTANQLLADYPMDFHEINDSAPAKKEEATAPTPKPRKANRAIFKKSSRG